MRAARGVEKSSLRPRPDLLDGVGRAADEGVADADGAGDDVEEVGENESILRANGVISSEAGGERDVLEECAYGVLVVDEEVITNEEALLRANGVILVVMGDAFECGISPVDDAFAENEETFALANGVISVVLGEEVEWWAGLADDDGADIDVTSVRQKGVMSVVTSELFEDCDVKLGEGGHLGGRRLPAEETEAMTRSMMSVAYAYVHCVRRYLCVFCVNVKGIRSVGVIAMAMVMVMVMVKV
jgi:hypothetical protein